MPEVPESFDLRKISGGLKKKGRGDLKNLGNWKDNSAVLADQDSALQEDFRVVLADFLVVQVVFPADPEGLKGLVARAEPKEVRRLSAPADVLLRRNVSNIARIIETSVLVEVQAVLALKAGVADQVAQVLDLRLTAKEASRS